MECCNMDSRYGKFLLIKMLAVIVAYGCVTTMLHAADLLDNPALNRIKKMPATNHDPLMLVRNGFSEAVVIIPQPPDANVKSDEYNAQIKIYGITKQAATELIKYVKAVTGAELPLLTYGMPLPQGKKLILVGESPLTQVRGVSAKELPLEGFRIQTFPEGLAIVGRMPDKRENYKLGGGAYVTDNCAALSVLFGVYDFLERFCEVRWYYPGELGTVVTPKSNLTVPPCNYTDWPEFKKRIGWNWTFFKPENPIGDFSGCRKYSQYFRAGDSSYIEHGSHSPWNFGVHREKNPECFELSKSGIRDSNAPCYGNPKTVDVMFDDLVRFYEQNDNSPYLSPKNKKPWHPPTSGRIVVSPLDKPVACNCKFCNKLWSNDFGYYGEASVILAEFTTNLARKIADKWPDKKVLFLPYANYLTCPDKTRMPDNVVPFVCLTYGAANHKEPHVTEYGVRTINAWSKAVGGRKVILWEYLCWPAMNTYLPFQYPHVIKEFYMNNRDKIMGTFVNGCYLGGYGKRALDDMTPGSDWAYTHPTIYCWYRLMWNPDFNVDAALDEYCTLMYGPAAPAMKEILTMLTNRWEQTKWREKIKDHNIKSSQIHNETMPKAQAAKLAELLKNAEQLAGPDSLFRKRVDFFGAPIKKFLEESEQFHSKNKLEMFIKKVGENPVIDGKLDDRCWNTAVKYPVKNALAIEKTPEPSASTIQAVWTDDGITFGIMNFEDFKPVANFVKHDDNIYEDDSVELFLQCGNNSTYFQVIVNSLGAYYDALGNDKGFNFKGIKIASSKGEKFWSCEIFIPFKELGIKSAPETEFAGNFARARKFEKGKEIVSKCYRWNTTYRPNNNDTNAFGKMKLVE